MVDVGSGFLEHMWQLRQMFCCVTANTTQNKEENRMAFTQREETEDDGVWCSSQRDRMKMRVKGKSEDDRHRVWTGSNKHIHKPNAVFCFALVVFVVVVLFCFVCLLLFFVVVLFCFCFLFFLFFCFLFFFFWGGGGGVVGINFIEHISHESFFFILLHHNLVACTRKNSGVRSSVSY